MACAKRDLGKAALRKQKQLHQPDELFAVQSSICCGSASNITLDCTQSNRRAKADARVLRSARMAGLFVVSERRISARVDLPPAIFAKISVPWQKVASWVGFAISKRAIFWMNLTFF